MSSYDFESPDPEHRDAVIAILNHYIKETTAAYRECCNLVYLEKELGPGA